MALLGGIQGGDLPCQESYPDPAVSLCRLMVTYAKVNSGPLRDHKADRECTRCVALRLWRRTGGTPVTLSVVGTSRWNGLLLLGSGPRISGSDRRGAGVCPLYLPAAVQETR